MRPSLRSSPRALDSNSKWKASYVYAAFDGLRQHIFRHELTTLSWSFFLRSGAGGGTVGESKFHNDGRYESSIRHGDTAWTWELVLDDKDRAVGVRVAQVGIDGSERERERQDARNKTHTARLTVPPAHAV